MLARHGNLCLQMVIIYFLPPHANQLTNFAASLCLVIIIIDKYRMSTDDGSDNKFEVYGMSDCASNRPENPIRNSPPLFDVRNFTSSLRCVNIFRYKITLFLAYTNSLVMDAICKCVCIMIINTKPI